MKFQNLYYMKTNQETDIFNYKTPEFYINMKSIPDKTSAERKSFVLEEKRKCREGININGVFIPGGLYMHLNYYYLEGDSRTNPGKKEVMHPTLRDNEWIIFNDHAECVKSGKIYLLFGGRQISKTECETSLCLREISLFKNTEAIALFANSQYRDNFVKKMRTAIQYGEKFIIIPNIDKDWNKDEIRFGLTKPDNTIDLRALLYIYNTQEGKKIQIGSGKTPSFMLIDEAAASPFKAVVDTLEPALLTDSGNLRCAPMITFTGGETEKAEDAKTMVEAPDKEKQFTTTLEDGKVIGGRFMDGRYRKDCKKQTTISEYTQKKTDTWLDNYPIFVTDFKYAEEKIQKERDEASKSPDKTTLQLKKIFFPLSLDDVFLKESGNKFPIEVIKAHQNFLKEKYSPLCVEFYRDIKGEVQWKHSDKRPINKFPIKPSDDKDAPVLIFEQPVKNAPHYTYCIGVDLIHNDDSNDKVVSLFSLYVYKRMLNPLDRFKNQVVCSVAYRPKSLEETHELALMIAEYYNAIEGVLPEASEQSFFQYFFLKKKGHFLANSFDLQSEIAKRNVKGGKKGLAPTTVNQNHYMNLLVEEANKEYIDIDEEGNEILSYGVTKEYDVMLLEEYKEYKRHTAGRGVHDGNFDRVISRGCAETLARYYDAKYPIASQIPNRNKEIVVERDYQRTMFGEIKKKSNSLDFSNKSNIKIPSWLRK